jgi:hypothetical protein
MVRWSSFIIRSTSHRHSRTQLVTDAVTLCEWDLGRNVLDKMALFDRELVLFPMHNPLTYAVMRLLKRVASCSIEHFLFCSWMQLALCIGRRIRSGLWKGGATGWSARPRALHRDPRCPLR